MCVFMCVPDSLEIGFQDFELPDLSGNQMKVGPLEEQQRLLSSERKVPCCEFYIIVLKDALM